MIKNALFESLYLITNTSIGTMPKHQFFHFQLDICDLYLGVHLISLKDAAVEKYFYQLLPKG
jgi:hypothetical protein